MSGSQPILEPVCEGGDAFFDALLGLDRVCRYLGQMIKDDGDEPATQPPPISDGLLDAVLGLWSMRTTIALVLDAFFSEPVDVEPAAAAAWSRELLR